VSKALSHYLNVRFATKTTHGPQLDRKRTFGQGLKAKHSHFIQYDWRSKLQTLDDYVAEIAMLG